MVYRPGRENARADALSRNPVTTPSDQAQSVKVGEVTSMEISQLLKVPPQQPGDQSHGEFGQEQCRDPDLQKMIQFLETGNLPDNVSQSQKIAAQALQFSLVDGILYFVDTKQQSKKQVVVPVQLRQKLLQEAHGGILAGHFSANRLFHTLSCHWWWDTMYRDCVDYCKNCVECAVVKGTGKAQRPPLHPIPVQRPFQIIGVDIMEFPMTQQGNVM